MRYKEEIWELSSQFRQLLYLDAPEPNQVEKMGKQTKETIVSEERGHLITLVSAGKLSG